MRNQIKNFILYLLILHISKITAITAKITAITAKITAITAITANFTDIILLDKLDLKRQANFPPSEFDMRITLHFCSDQL